MEKLSYSTPFNILFNLSFTVPRLEKRSVKWGLPITLHSTDVGCFYFLGARNSIFVAMTLRCAPQPLPLYMAIYPYSSAHLTLQIKAIISHHYPGKLVHFSHKLMPALDALLRYFLHPSTNFIGQGFCPLLFNSRCF